MKSMKIMSDEYTNKFLSENPTVLARQSNRHGQRIVYYEHPNRGDEAPIYGLIQGILFDTGTFDLEDLVCNPPHVDYTPVLWRDKIVCECDL